MFVCSRYHEESLRPPPESGGGDWVHAARIHDPEEDPPWDCGEEALIDILAYMVDERNHTTARCPFRATAAGTTEELQVTFCLAPPPHISHFSVAYTSGEPTRFISEPLILATAGNLALISVKQGPTWLPRSTDYTYLVYHAAPTPALSVLPLPKAELFPEERCYLVQGEATILPLEIHEAPRCHSQQEAYKIAALYTRDVDGEYDVSGIKKLLYTRDVDGEYDVSGIKKHFIYIYDSNTDAWTREPTVFLQEPAPPSFCSDRVITVGGTIIWVDLSQGMILCQVSLSGDEESSSSPGPRQLRYIRLPTPLQPRDHLPICISTSSFSRDINIVDGRISFVDLEIHASPGSLLPNCWTAITWSMAVSDSEFHKVREVKSAQVASVAALDPQSFFVAHPTLSSHNGDILYLMAKTTLDPLDNHSSVIAVDMRCRKMERVAKYTTQRGGSMDFAYMLTTISKYLAPPGDSNAIPKKRGPAFLGSSSRKEAAFTLPRYGGDQAEGDGGIQMEAFPRKFTSVKEVWPEEDQPRYGGDQVEGDGRMQMEAFPRKFTSVKEVWPEEDQPRYGGDQAEDGRIWHMKGFPRKFTSVKEVWPEEDHEDKLPKVKRMFLSRKV